MPNEKLIKELKTFVKGESDTNPPPTIATINKVYEGWKYIDCLLANDNILKYVKCMGNPVINEDAIIIFLDGDINSPFAITK